MTTTAIGPCKAYGCRWYLAGQGKGVFMRCERCKTDRNLDARDVAEINKLIKKELG